MCKKCTEKEKNIKVEFIEFVETFVKSGIEGRPLPQSSWTVEVRFQGQMFIPSVEVFNFGGCIPSGGVTIHGWGVGKYVRVSINPINGDVTFLCGTSPVELVAIELTGEERVRVLLLVQYVLKEIMKGCRNG